MCAHNVRNKTKFRMMIKLDVRQILSRLTTDADVLYVCGS